jgi:tRNA(Arg) A34 adenosine deaminase TadA
MNDIEIDHLKASISVAWRARENGNHPFGAVLVDEHNRVVLEAENTVVTGRDSTGHAETNLVRLATQQFSPEQLVHYTLYSSTEPCAMCAGAIHWSQIGRVVYALSEVDLYGIIGPSPEHLLLPCREVFAHSSSHIEVYGPIASLEIEARAVHKDFWGTV